MREPEATIILPGGDEWRPERRSGAARHRPYTARDGAADEAPRPPRDRRRRKRPAVDDLRGCRYDLEV